MKKVYEQAMEDLSKELKEDYRKGKDSELYKVIEPHLEELRDAVYEETAKEIFADLEAEQLHICGNWRLHKIPEECMGEEVIAKLKKKYLGDVTFLKKKAQPKKVKK